MTRATRDTNLDGIAPLDEMDILQRIAVRKPCGIGLRMDFNWPNWTDTDGCKCTQNSFVVPVSMHESVVATAPKACGS